MQTPLATLPERLEAFNPSHATFGGEIEDETSNDGSITTWWPNIS